MDFVMHAANPCCCACHRALMQATPEIKSWHGFLPPTAAEALRSWSKLNPYRVKRL